MHLLLTGIVVLLDVVMSGFQWSRPPPEATAPHMPQAMMPPAGLQAPMYPGMGAAPVPSMPRRDWVVPHAEGSDPWDLVKSVSPSSPMSDVSHGSFSKPQAPPQHYYDMNSLLDALEHSVSEGSHHPHPSITGAQAMQQPSSTSGDRRDVFRGMAMSLGALSGNLGGRWTTNLIPVGGSDSPKGSMPQSMGFSDTSSTMNPFSSGTTSMTSSAPLSYRDEIAVLQSKVRRLSSEAPNESFGKGKQPTSSPLEQGLQLELPYQRVSLDEDAHEGSSTPVGHVLKTQGKGFNYPRKYPSDDTDRDSEGVLEGSEISSTSASTASSHFRSGAVSTKSNGTTTSLHR